MRKGEIQRQRGSWSPEEDQLLINYVSIHGEGKWRRLVEHAGLKRCPKSARQRWKNYLNPKIKREDITADEEDLIIRLHRLLGNRWSLIAGRLPGRTDNQIKNYWNTCIVKKQLIMNVDSSCNTNNNIQKTAESALGGDDVNNNNNKTDNLVLVGGDDDDEGMTLLDIHLMLDLFPDLDGCVQV